MSTAQRAGVVLWAIGAVLVAGSLALAVFVAATRRTTVTSAAPGVTYTTHRDAVADPPWLPVAGGCAGLALVAAGTVVRRQASSA